MKFKQAHLAYGMYDRLYLQQRAQNVNMCSTLQLPFHQEAMSNTAAGCSSEALKAWSQTKAKRVTYEPV